MLGGLFVHQLICDVEFEVTDAVEVFVYFGGFSSLGFCYFL